MFFRIGKDWPNFQKWMAIGLMAGLYLLVSNCQGEESIRTAQFYTNGHQLYVQHCQNCHGDKGEGLGTLYPPLSDTAYLTNHRNQLPEIIRYGMRGEITVNGQVYDMEMPANPQLSDVEIAYLLTYITNSFGNKSGIYRTEEVVENLPRTSQ